MNNNNISFPSPFKGGAKGEARSDQQFKTAHSDIYSITKVFANENKNAPTDAESYLWEYLRNKQMGVKFRRQHVIGDYIADFVCLSQRLVVEIDGGYHFTKEQKEYDRIRTEYLRTHGYDELRFTNEEVLQNIDNVLENIQRYIDNE